MKGLWAVRSCCALECLLPSTCQGSQVGSLPLQEAMSTLSSFLFQIKSLISHLRTKIWALYHSWRGRGFCQLRSHRALKVIMPC